MKSIYVLLYFLLPLSLFSQSFNWMQTVGDIKSDFGDHVATDKYGNVFVTGHAQGTCNFGARTIASATQFNFIAKYDSNGTNLWVQQIAAFSYMGVDTSGGIIMVINGGGTNILRIDRSGNTAFSYSIPVQGGVNFTGLDIDRVGNYIVSGTYPSYNNQSFYGKFKEHGAVTNADTALWNINVYPADQSTAMVVNAVTTSDKGFMVMGQFGNTYTAKDIYGDSIVLNATQGILGTDVMWLKYDSLGYLTWAKNYNNSNTFASVIYDSTSNSYYSQQLDWTTFMAYGQRWDSIGELVWNTALTDVSAGLQPFVFMLPKLKINNGYLYFIGGNADFTNTSLGTNTTGVFVLKRFTLNGTLVDSALRPLNSLLFLGDVSFSGNSIVLTGGYDGNITWGNESLLNGDSIDNMFVGKIGIDSLFQSPTIVNSISADTKNNSDIIVYPNPTKDKIEIWFAFQPGQVVEMYLTDLLGNSIYTEQPFDSGTFIKTIDVSNVTSGMYLLTILSNGKTQAKKIAVVKN